MGVFYRRRFKVNGILTTPLRTEYWLSVRPPEAVTPKIEDRLAGQLRRVWLGGRPKWRREAALNWFGLAQPQWRCFR